MGVLASIGMVLVTLVPVAFTMVRVFPMLLRFFRYVWILVRGGAVFGRNPMWGIMLSIFAFVGGFGFFISLYFGWGFELYLKFLDIVFTPFAYAAEHLIASFVNQLPNLPSNAASVLCLFDFSRCFALLMMGFSFEVYMRILIYFLVRRGK